MGAWCHSLCVERATEAATRRWPYRRLGELMAIREPGGYGPDARPEVTGAGALPPDRHELQGRRGASVLHGDTERVSSRKSWASRCSRPDCKSMIYRYGSRPPVLLLRMLAERDIRIRSSRWHGLEAPSRAAAAIVEAGHEVVSHGGVDRLPVHGRGRRARHMRLAIQSLARVTEPPSAGTRDGSVTPAAV